MGQTNSTQSELEPCEAFYEPIVRFYEFENLSNFYYDDFNRLRSGRNPNSRRAYWEQEERIGPPFPYIIHLAYNPLENSNPDLGLTLEGAYIDVGQDLEDAFE